MTSFTALAQAEPGKQNAIRTAWWLWVGLFLLGVMLVLIVAAIGKRRRQAIVSSVEPKRARVIKDAWEEAGKRVDPLPDDGGDDEDKR